MKEKVEAALQKIRPMLAVDGGGIELVSVDQETGVVKVRLTGACGFCPMAQLTLQSIVEHVLKREVPEITKVEAL